MFVRWKRRNTNPKRTRGWPGLAEHSLYAVLVRSDRVDGKPRQRVVRYLAHIGEQYTGATAHQQYFWERVDAQLDDLGLDDAIRQSVTSSLIEVVPRPSSQELAQLKRDQERVARAPLPR